MSAAKTPTLKERYEWIVNTYTDQFCKTHDVELEHWVGGRVAEVACISSYFLQLDEIRYDIDNEVTKGKIWEWCELMSETMDYKISYRNFLKME